MTDILDINIIVMTNFLIISTWRYKIGRIHFWNLKITIFSMWYV